MAKFDWTGQSRDGDMVSGTYDAKNKEEVLDRLRTEHITPRKIAKQARDISFSIGTGVSHQDILIFTRHIMLGSHVFRFELWNRPR